MLAAVSVFLFVAALQVVSCQGPPPFPPNVPPQCRGPPKGLEKPHDCCKIPPFFTEKDFEECGFKKLEDESPGRRGPPDCTKQLCMMKKYNLLKGEDSLDYEAVNKFLDTWAKTNPDFQSVISKAKEQCVGKQLPGPPQICEANKIVFCLTSYIFKNCPKWEDDEGCKNLKAHIDECSQYFAH